ncbi:MAG: glycosyltransferase [Acidimicrobiia bacterium]|nr:glycosyltransferase [Acidimicrobiia bacterium]
MILFVLLLAQVVLVVLIAYQLLTALWGLHVPHQRPVDERGLYRFRAVIPAHNEESVIGVLLDDLGRQDIDRSRIMVHVVADRCGDATADRAQPSDGVFERSDGEEGKGAALQWYLDQAPLAEDEALVVLDADNRIPAGFLRRLSLELDAGNTVLQAYVDASNPGASLLSTASALTYWASNRMVQLSRRNLGWSSDLLGTGMCLTAAAVRASGGFANSVTEDKELGARLLLAGHRVEWLHDANIGDEKPKSLSATLGQRARWASGRRATARLYVPKLLRSAARQRSIGLADFALRLMQPSRAFLALITVVLLVLSATFRDSSRLLPLWIWVAVVTAQMLLPFIALALDRVPVRYLAQYPLIATFGILWIPIGLLSRLRGGWFHTPHGDEQ